jgi:uncharacterized protein YfaS (alpha-2-macroglobulin family)
MKRIVLIALVALSLSGHAWASALAADSAPPPSVETFSPQGEVKGVRQVAVRFSEPMVPFGDPRLPDPFDVAAAAKGKGRWADERNWVYDFDEDLPAGIACTFTLRPSLAALSGRPVGGNRTFSFNTGGPAILRSFPYEGSHYIDEEQAFLLQLDAAADEASILANTSFSVDGIEEAVGVRIVKGEARRKLLTLGPGRGLIRLPRNARGERDTLEFRRKKDAADDPRVVVLQAKQRFPAGADVQLVWGSGIRSLTGVATTSPQELAFRTRPPFRLTFTCDREDPKGPCLPMLPMSVNFSAPVSLKLARQVTLVSTSGRTIAPATRGNDEDGNAVHQAVFPGPFPENAAYKVRLPKDFRDDSGREAENADRFPLAVATGGYPPLAKFAAPFGIVEWTGEGVLPVTLRNIEAQAKSRLLGLEDEGARPEAPAADNQSKPVPRTGRRAAAYMESMDAYRDKALADLTGRIRPVAPGRAGETLAWLRKIERVYQYHEPPTLLSESVIAPEKAGREFKLPRPGGDNAFEVIGIPMPKPGFYVVEIESGKLGDSLLRKKPMYIPTAVLVTNLSAHLKLGRESSAVWVTTLDKGEPVAGAQVAIHDSAGKRLWKGETGADGLARVDEALAPAGEVAECGSFCGYFVTARKGDDESFVSSAWQQGIEAWRFREDGGEGTDTAIAHTVFDRSLFRAGETVSMKHFLRRHFLGGLKGVDPAKRPKGLAIVHGGSDQRFFLPLSWDASGSAESAWKIPKDAKLGDYSVYQVDDDLSAESGKNAVGKYVKGDERFWAVRKRLSGAFRVEEFRVPLMKGSVRPVSTELVRPASAELDLTVSYLSGGGAGGATVKLRTDFQPSAPSFPGYGEYNFANGPVAEGLVRGSSRYEAENEDGEGGDGAPGKKQPVRTTALVLDGSGVLRTKVGKIPAVKVPSDLVAELEYADPNGEIQTVSARVPMWPSRLLPGILPDSWAVSKDAFRFKVAVVDLAGKPVPGAEVGVDLFQRKQYSHRKRLIGGFYAYEHVVETKRLVAGFCSGRTDDKGLLFCEAKSPVDGNLILEARVADDNGAIATANRDVWVAGKDDWWFDQQDGDRMDLLPERKRYEPGETAKLQLRMPFREATALVTVEREGVLETFVRKVGGKSPVVEIPILPHYAPNVFVSALVVRGRESGVAPTATVDLGRPSWRLGNTEIDVGWKAHELLVTVSPERPTYSIREKVKARVRVTRADGGALPPGSEAAVAAVDEGLLELSANESWQLLRAMMGRRPHEVGTATAQGQVIGKRHFGLKALPSGGGGGRQSARKLFDTLLFWKARVPLDANGEAEIEIPLNDSLTAFRLVAVANGSDSFFGTGQATVRTTQPLMILAGLPPLVREGDRFRAAVTVRNGSDHPISAVVRASVSGESGKANGLPKQDVSLAPGQGREVAWEFAVPPGGKALAWKFEAAASDNAAFDRVEVGQKVVESVPVRTVQATIARLEAPMAIEVSKPADALAGRGGLSVELKARLSEGIGGLRYFMERYPYDCLEQRVSVAVSLRDKARWDEIVSSLPAYLDGDGLVKYFPMMYRGSDTLTAYLVSIADEAGWALPEALESKMLAGLEGFIKGSVLRDGTLKTADLSIRKVAALEALSRRKKGRPELLDSITLAPKLWPTSALLDWMNVILMLGDLPDRDARFLEAEMTLRSRLNFQGTTMGFSTERTDAFWWLMVSGDVNAVKGLLTFMKLPKWQADIPRVVNGAIGRQRRGAWSTTVANAWGVLAMEKFSQKYESVPVTGTTRVLMGKETRTADWSKDPKGDTLLLPWPKGRGSVAMGHEGNGAPWATVRAAAAIPLKAPLSTGYRIRKKLSAVSRKVPGKWSRGDVIRVTLDLESQADMTWVVVDDPIPAGASILGSGLGRDSALMTRGERREGLAWPAFEERGFEGFRAFYEFVPKGKWTVSYTVRLNNGGRFVMPPTRVEAMYAPEMFGESPNPPMTTLP